MQRKPNASLDFIEKPVETKPPFGRSVALAMTGNAAVPAPPHNVAAMDTANDELDAAITDAQTGDHNKIAIRDAKELAWNNVFRDNGNYVTSRADGDKVIITGAGFKATVTETSPIQIPGIAQEADFTTNQKKGSIHVKTEAIPDAAGYISILATPDMGIAMNGNQILVKSEKGFVSIVVDTHKVVDHNGLPSHIDFNAQVAAFNRAGTGEFTNPEVVGTL